MKTIQLTRGKVSIVDDEDFKELSKYKWYFTTPGYAARDTRVDGKRVCILMHRLLNETPIGMETDHINNDRLDNRRSNLRACTRSQNMANIRTPKSNTSGYRGVTWDKKAQKWMAQIMVNYKTIFLGYFDDPSKGAEAYKTASQKHFRNFANKETQYA